MDFQPVEYLQRLQLFFLKRGKKTSLEAMLRRWLVDRAARGKTSVYSLLHSCILYGTPFISLKTRRRGKRVFYKVGYTRGTQIIGGIATNAQRTKLYKLCGCIRKGDRVSCFWEESYC